MFYKQLHWTQCMTNEHKTYTAPVDDPLLACLFLLMQRYHMTLSKEVLLASLPLENHKLTPALFITAASRTKINAQLTKRPLNQVHDLLLPAVLILKNNQACILNRWINDETAEILRPETGEHPVQINYKTLEENYSGDAILVTPENTAAKQPDNTTLKQSSSWFWGTLWHYRHIYTEVMVAAFFINIFALAVPLFVMTVYDRVIPNTALVTLWSLAIGIFIIFAFDLTLRFLRSYLIDVAGKKADILLASSLFQHVLNMNMINKPSSIGSFASTLREFETIRDFFTSATLVSIVDVPFIIIYIALIWYIGSYIVFVPLLAVPAILLTVYFIEKPLYQAVSAVTEANAQRHGIMVEGLSNLEDIKSFRAEGLFQHKWDQAVATGARLSLRARFLSGFVSQITYLFQQLVVVAVVIIGVYLVKNNLLTIGGIIACSILAGRVIAPLGQLANTLTRYQQAKYSLNALDEFMQQPTELSLTERPITREHINGEIEFQHVSFQYKGQEHSKALTNVSFKVKPGEHVAILGKIGSGKSTIAKLLLAFYQPQQGSIYIDGIDILQWHPSDLRHHIGYVQQDVRLFSGTIRDNITLGKPTATDDEVIAAAKLAGVDKFINRHPLGYNLPVGERGEGLSGGQRQTIAIARALITKPSVLIFDEPTSSMDEGLEREWMMNMKKHLLGKTMILVTHKPSVIVLADRIIILDSGKIILDGPRDEILKKITRPATPL